MPVEKGTGKANRNRFGCNIGCILSAKKDTGVVASTSYEMQHDSKVSRLKSA